MKLILRALDPATDIGLFHEAYNWRRHSPKLYPDKMKFEDFASDDPSQIVMGLFNGELCAVYLITVNQNGICDTHYSCHRGAPREYVLAGARWLLSWLLENGALEVTAFVSERNRPLSRFVEAIGFSNTGTGFPCQNDADGCSVSPRFTKYAARSQPSD